MTGWEGLYAATLAAVDPDSVNAKINFASSCSAYLASPWAISSSIWLEFLESK